MKSDIETKITNEHFLKKNTNYYIEGKEAIKSLCSVLNEEQKNQLLKGLQIDTDNYKEDQYLQYAIETTINLYFKNRYQSFLYEPKSSTTQKNMDCGIEIDGLKINFEIKCPKVSKKKEKTLYTKPIGFKKEDIDKKILPIITELKKIEGKVGYENILSSNEIGGALNKISTMKDFLEATNEKARNNEINILIVALYSKDDFSEWVDHFYDIINKKMNIKAIDKVDGIIFTNTINHHINFQEKSWNWEDHLSFFLINPMANNFSKEILKEKIKIIFSSPFIFSLEERIIKFNKNIKLIKEQILKELDYRALNEKEFSEEIEKRYKCKRLFIPTELILELEKINNCKYFISEEDYSYFKER